MIRMNVGPATREFPQNSFYLLLIIFIIFQDIKIVSLRTTKETGILRIRRNGTYPKKRKRKEEEEKEKEDKQKDVTRKEHDTRIHAY